MKFFTYQHLKYSMTTRKCLKTRSCKCGDLYEFRSQKIFELGVLPTTRDVLERLFYEPNYKQRVAATTVAEELMKLWSRCNVYHISISGVISRMKSWSRIFAKLIRYLK